ncbi:MAG: ATP-binding protein [Planctomycetota bacterium]
MTAYRIRETTEVLLNALHNMPVVVLSGLRQSGKSTLLLKQPELKRRRYISFDDFNSLEAARINPDGIISGSAPVTIDEAQKLPGILTFIKQSVDKKRIPGRFLLSGSANFLLLKNIAESLAGRAVYLTLHPFSRREITGSTKELPALVYFINKGVFPQKDVKPIASREIIKGGMPSICLNEVKEPAIWFRGYEQTYLERDIRSLSQVADLVPFRHLLRLISLRNAQILKQSELARDAKLNVMTANRYLSLIETSFVISRLAPHLRNRSSRLIKSPKLYLSDTGLACYLAGIEKLDASEPLAGAMMENYVYQNLNSILSAYHPEAKITYWSIQGRYEVDFIIEIGSETIAIEVKAGSRWQERDLTGLKAFLNTSRKCRVGILAYNGTQTTQLADRIWAIPIGLLLS